MVIGKSVHLILLISKELCMHHTKDRNKLLMRMIPIFDLFLSMEKIVMLGLKVLFLRIQYA